MERNLRRQPDFEQFLRVLRREGQPDHLPLYEHIASGGFIARRTGQPFESMSPDSDEYWQTYVDFWIGMGFDEVPIEVVYDCDFHLGHGGGAASIGSESSAVIATMEDFERFAWPPEERPVNFKYYEKAAQFLPEGAKLVAGVCMGPYEWVSQMMGVQGLAMGICTEPDLVRTMFDKIDALHTSAVRQLAQMDAVGALRQGDDLGFKTSTFLAPDMLREYVFPVYRHLADEAHKQNKPFILHSCGNLKDVYEDLIEDCGIDAKHSFEEQIMPVTEFKKQYGDRITPLGGLDVDRICQYGEEELRAYTRGIVEQCYADGFWALGTGNSLTNYMPVENYLIVIDEALAITGR